MVTSMILWTIQPVETVDILARDGIYTCNTSLSENYSDFKEAYLWLVNEMDKRHIPHPQNIELPLWAWHTRDWEHKEPDFREPGLGIPGIRYACIEFEIPDEYVLLSDYNNWHYVLNKSWFDDSRNEDEFDELHEWFDSLDEATRYSKTVDSWQKIFDVKPEKSDWEPKGAYVQATFWELKADMVRDVKYFTAR